MIKYENECCGCAVPAYPCLGNSCPNRKVPHYYCDSCRNEDILYNYDGEQLCKDCLIDRFDIIEGSEL